MKSPRSPDRDASTPVVRDWPARNCRKCRLYSRWGDLATTADIDIREESIRLVADDPDRTAAADASLAVQTRAAVQEIDEHAAATGRAAARTAEAALLLQAARPTATPHLRLICGIPGGRGWLSPTWTRRT